MVQQGEKTSLKVGEVKAMIELLDETDNNTVNLIIQKLNNYGLEVMPFLLEALDETSNLEKSHRLKKVIREIQCSSIKLQLQQWASTNQPDLLEAYLLLNSLENPDIDIKLIRKEVQHLIKDVWLELNDHLTALEKVKVINHVLYRIKGFDTNNPDSLESSYISGLLKSKKGTPVSLGILYLIISQQLSLPVYGVNLPHHFVLSYLDKHLPRESDSEMSHPVMFYINPFNKGTVFTQREVRLFLEQMNIPEDGAYYNACDNKLIIKRFIETLKKSYLTSNKKEMADYLEDIATAF